MTSRIVFLIIMAATTVMSTSANILRGGRSILGVDMQPEVVARTLKGVEDKWHDEAVMFMHCNVTDSKAPVPRECAEAPNVFAKSCATVVSAIVQGSSGNAQDAKEYMADICRQQVLSGWHQQHCMGLKSAVEGAMTADTYQNRRNFAANKMCMKFWSSFFEIEKERVSKEEQARMEAEKKAAEEAAERAKKEQEEKAALEKKAREEAEKRAAEEAARKKIEEAQKLKAEAQAKAAKAAAALAKKKAEAEEFAKRAKEKMEEAAEAEREHLKSSANMSAHINVTASTENKENQSVAIPAVVMDAPNETSAESAKKNGHVAVVTPAVPAKTNATVAVTASKRQNKNVFLQIGSAEAEDVNEEDATADDGEDSASTEEAGEAGDDESQQKVSNENSEDSERDEASEEVDEESGEEGASEDVEGSEEAASEEVPSIEGDMGDEDASETDEAQQDETE